GGSRGRQRRGRGDGATEEWWNGGGHRAQGGAGAGDLLPGWRKRVVPGQPAHGGGDGADGHPGRSRDAGRGGGEAGSGGGVGGDGEGEAGLRQAGVTGHSAAASGAGVRRPAAAGGDAGGGQEQDAAGRGEPGAHRAAGGGERAGGGGGADQRAVSRV